MRLQRMSETQGFRLTRDSRDIRGWRVLDEQARQLGRVDDLLFDPEANLVRQIVIDLPEQRQVVWPASRLRFQDADQAVVAEGLSARDLEALDAYTGEPIEELGEADLPRRLQLREERLQVDKKQVRTGEVEITRHPVLENVEQEVMLWDEEADVARRPIGRPATEADRIVVEGDTIRVPVIRERLVVEKRPYLVEEIVITKRRRSRSERVHEQVKRDRIYLDGEPLPDMLDRE